MFSKTEIYNIALTNLGISSPLQNYNESDPRAIILNNYYDLARDTVLEMHDWSFAGAFKKLSNSIEESPDPRFQYCFKLPNDCIASRAIIDPVDNKEKEFYPMTDINGAQVIVTNSNPCILRYTRRVENTSYFTAAFVNALGYYLAYQIAINITGSANKKNTNYKDFQMAIRQAMLTDARKTVNHDQDDFIYTDSRD